MISDILRFCLFLTMLLASCTNVLAQFLDRRTHLAPPMGAFNGDDYEQWDEIYCRTQIFTEDGTSTTFTAELSRERLEKTPDWDGLDPKVSPGTALHLAKRQFINLKPFGDCKYRYELQLQQYWGKWLWATVFTPIDEHGLRGDINFPVFVLMDGAALRPKTETHQVPVNLLPKKNAR